MNLPAVPLKLTKLLPRFARRCRSLINVIRFQHRKQEWLKIKDLQTILFVQNCQFHFFVIVVVVVVFAVAAAAAVSCVLGF
jgi:hypothetical protein